MHFLGLEEIMGHEGKKKLVKEKKNLNSVLDIEK